MAVIDKKSLPVLILCVLLLVFWGPITDFLMPPAPQQPGQQGISTNQVERMVPSPSPTPTLESVSSLAQLSKGSPSRTPQTWKLENSSVEVRFTDGGGAIESIRLKHFSEAKQGDVVLNRDSPVPLFATSLGEIGFLEPYVYNVSSNVSRVSYRSSKGLVLTKEYVLRDDYLIDVRVWVQNSTEEPISEGILRVGLGVGTPLNAQDKGEHVGITVRTGRETFNETAANLSRLAQSKKVPFEKVQVVDWVAVKNHYYTMITTPAASFGKVLAETFPIPSPAQKTATHPALGVLGVLESQPFHLAAGAATNWSFQIYAGPKEYRRLVSLGREQDHVLDYGTFAVISKTLIYFMGLFHSVLFGNWGLAIVAVTIVIKILFWPLTAISTKSMKQMQLLAPEINKLKEKYQNDSKKMNEEMMKLYREYKINPMAGCLPMLIQIPIFIAFYNMLLYAIELRGAPFVLWITDLSRPDTIYRLPGLDFPINPLPLLMAATMIWQTRITPQAPNADPSMKLMMWMMPAMFLFFCYNSSSGLSLYWTVQNLLTILQTYITKDRPVEAPQRAKRRRGFGFGRPPRS